MFIIRKCLVCVESLESLTPGEAECPNCYRRILVTPSYAVREVNVYYWLEWIGWSVAIICLALSLADVLSIRWAYLLLSAVCTMYVVQAFRLSAIRIKGITVFRETHPWSFALLVTAFLARVR